MDDRTIPVKEVSLEERVVEMEKRFTLMERVIGKLLTHTHDSTGRIFVPLDLQ